LSAYSYVINLKERMKPVIAISIEHYESLLKQATED